MDFVVDILNDVGVIEDFEDVDFLVIGCVADGLFDGDWLKT